MAPGKEYEKFIYDKMKIAFPDFKVTLDEKIVGKISGIQRQIDVTIRGFINSIEILYLIQCKDYTRKADIIKVGEFSSVIEDVGATKGFLICSAGFANSIRRYAKSKRIDLYTVQDINHPKWSIKVQIPILYKKSRPVDVDIAINFPGIPTHFQHYIHQNRDVKSFTRVSFDDGKTSETLREHINKILKENKIDLIKKPYFGVRAPANIGDIWLPVNIEFNFNFKTDYYFFFVDPIEYAQIQDHITGEVTPIHFTVSYSAFKLNPNNKIDIDKFNYLNSYAEVTEEMSEISSLDYDRAIN
ncbi:hypothetical protein GCM10028819_32350 [Spirosoma humi]